MDESLKDPAAVTALALDALSTSIQASFIAMIGIPAEIAIGATLPPEAEDSVIVTGLIGLLGNWKGTGILECSPGMACQMSNLMLGVDDSLLKDDGMDAVAEMSNIIFGTMKTALEDALGYMGMSTPTVICGTNIGMYNAGSGLSTIPVRVGEYNVHVKLSLARAEEKRRPATTPAHLDKATCAVS